MEALSIVVLCMNKTVEIKEYEVSRAPVDLELIGLPEYDYDSTVLEPFAQSGIQGIIGCSANVGRRKIGEDIAKKVGVPYRHAKLAADVDELTKKQHEQVFPGEIATFGAALAYQLMTLYSKHGRLRGLPDIELDKLGLHKNSDAISRTLLLFADSISILDNERIFEKPETYDEGLMQISEIVDEQHAYYLSSMQLAMWASGVDGIAHSVDLLPIRVNRNLSNSERKVLKKNWIKLYDDEKIPLTPGAASASNLEIFPYIQVGLLKHRRDHVRKSVYSADNFINSEQLVWKSTMELPELVRREIWTSMTGASPFGFIEAMKSLAINSLEVTNKFFTVPKSFDLAGKLSGAQVNIPNYATTEYSI